MTGSSSTASASSTSWKKALCFDSDELNAIVKHLGLLKALFKNKMPPKAQYLKFVTHEFNDKDGQRGWVYGSGQSRSARCGGSGRVRKAHVR